MNREGYGPGTAGLINNPAPLGQMTEKAHFGLLEKRAGKDPTILMLGAAYAASDRLTLRFGGNYIRNPVSAYTPQLPVPRIVTPHLTTGFVGGLLDASISPPT